MQNSEQDLTVFRRVQAASAAGDYALMLDLFDTYPVECWFGGSPAEFAAVLRTLPPHAAQLSPFVHFSTKMLVGDTSDLLEPTHRERQTVREVSGGAEPWHEVMRCLAFRVLGYLQESAQAMPERDTTQPASNYSPQENVSHAAVRLTRGTTLMLMCRFAEARKELVGVHAALLPDELQVMRRDALLKSALIESMYGDQRLARGHLRLAADIPRTASWVEPHLDAQSALVVAVVAEREDRALALRQLNEYPLQAFGEMWPFAVLALQRVHNQLGRRAEFASKLELFADSAPVHIDSNGLSGSAIHLAHAMFALNCGDIGKTREYVLLADHTLLLTKRVYALMNMCSGSVDLALRYAREIRPETKTLRQFEVWRASLEVSALLASGETDEAKLMLTVVLSELNGLNAAELRVFPTDVHQFADACNIGWPRMHDGDDSFAIAPTLPSVVLSERERQVLTQVVLGRSRAETAQQLFVSENTVKTHLSALYKKFGVANRAQLIAEARLRSLI